MSSKIQLNEDQEKLVKYFLGELSEDQELEVDERLFLDSAYGESVSEVELALTDAYVAGSLTPQQREHFKTRYMVTPDRRKAVEAAYLLRLYYTRIADTNDRFIFPVPMAAKKSWWRRPTLFHLIAAGLVIALLGGGLAWLAFWHGQENATHEAKTTPAVERSVSPQQNAAAPQAIAPPPSSVARSGQAQTPPSAVKKFSMRGQPLVVAKADATVRLPAPPSIDVSTNNGDSPELSAMNPPLPLAPAVTGKPLIIVDDFDYSTVMTSVQAIFGKQENIGKAIRAMLDTRLAKEDKISVVERSHIAALESEQDRFAGNRVKQGLRERTGRISGADALLTGDITVFGRDYKHTGNLGGRSGGVAGISSTHSEDKAVVAISYRLVDARTSEVIKTGEVRGESMRKGKAGAFVGDTLRASGTVDMTSSNFSESLIGEATQDAVNKLAAILDAESAELGKAEPGVIEAAVTDVSGDILTITAGLNEEVRQGDVFEILKVIRAAKDPTTHEVLDYVTEKVGEMTITSVTDRTASGTFQGTSTPQTGYIAQKKR